jgi:response regulator NasT
MSGQCQVNVRKKIMQSKSSKSIAVVIARDEARCAELQSAAQIPGISEVVCCVSGVQARAANIRQARLILLSTPLSDEYGLDLAAELSHRTSAPILLLTKGETAAEVRKKLGFTGAYVLARPVSRQALQTAVYVAVQAADCINQMKDELEEQGLVFKAKVLLMTHRHMSEEDAHRYLQKLAMDNRKRLTETARTVSEQLEQDHQDLRA